MLLTIWISVNYFLNNKLHDLSKYLPSKREDLSSNPQKSWQLGWQCTSLILVLLWWAGCRDRRDPGGWPDYAVASNGETVSNKVEKKTWYQDCPLHTYCSIHTNRHTHTIYTMHNINAWILRPGLENDGVFRTRKQQIANDFRGNLYWADSSLKCLVYQSTCSYQKHIKILIPY